MWRWPTKLIRSRPGVPSATPAQASRACTGPPQASTAALMDARDARSTPMAVTPSSATSARSITTTSAPASRANSAAAAPIPVAPPTTSTRLPSNRNESDKSLTAIAGRYLKFSQ